MNDLLPIIDLDSFTKTMVDGYANHALTNVNDLVVRLSIMTEDFYWHFHPYSDETFLVIEGTLLLDLEQETVTLKQGQMYTVPQNVHHCTRPESFFDFSQLQRNKWTKWISRSPDQCILKWSKRYSVAF
ncbi:cupin domain-containing protein [Mucilaginibacter sp. R-33]|uniref:cupin domain-containing protein n=1 Tax=Mucilaginibacter sp. R-33 TaxID=3416711 RepID=UPI003CF4C6B6